MRTTDAWRSVGVALFFFFVVFLTILGTTRGEASRGSWFAWLVDGSETELSAPTGWRDGTWRAAALGYTGDVEVSIIIRDGRIAAVEVRHEESIDLGACFFLPRRIVDRQTPDIDGITGATVTSEALVEAAMAACRKAEHGASVSNDSRPMFDALPMLLPDLVPDANNAK